tara:strand:- start:15 stop:680 length:666 start_codon:yes stop_codon:yes gene_type:complete
MKIFLDSSDVDEISNAYETGLIDGVTTNPTLIMKSGRSPRTVLSEIAEIFPWDSSVSAEVVADTADDMLDIADDYLSINQNITIKVPCTVAGLKTCKELTKDDISVNVTLVFTQSQAILAAKAGAEFVSPFVGRVDDNSFGGLCLIKDIANVFAKHKVTKTNVLAASIRNVRDVGRAFEYGANVVTMPPNIFWGMYNHILTEKGLSLFNADWKKVQSHEEV